VTTPPHFERPRRQTLPRSFRAAFAGLFYGLRTQRNLQIHAAAAVLVVLAAIVLRLTRVEWCLIVLCIGLMAAAELLNTAVEVTLDRLWPQYDDGVRVAKDVAAAAVLMAAITSIVVGLIVFVPRLIEFCQAK
jgi:diacylglycerol kinase (ATP)